MQQTRVALSAIREVKWIHQSTLRWKIIPQKMIWQRIPRHVVTILEAFNQTATFLPRVWSQKTHYRSLPWHQNFIKAAEESIQTSPIVVVGSGHHLPCLVTFRRLDRRGVVVGAAFLQGTLVLMEHMVFIKVILQPQIKKKFSIAILSVHHFPSNDSL